MTAVILFSIKHFSWLLIDKKNVIFTQKRNLLKENAAERKVSLSNLELPSLKKWDLWKVKEALVKNKISLLDKKCNKVAGKSHTPGAI